MLMLAWMAAKVPETKDDVTTPPGEYHLSLSQEQAIATHLKLLKEKQAAAKKEQAIILNSMSKLHGALANDTPVNGKTSPLLRPSHQSKRCYSLSSSIYLHHAECLPQTIQIMFLVLLGN
jgi:hypothetical protein